jgi:hypothetical protein
MYAWLPLDLWKFVALHLETLIIITAARNEILDFTAFSGQLLVPNCVTLLAENTQINILIPHCCIYNSSFSFLLFCI